MDVFHLKYEKHFKFCSKLLSLAIKSLTLLPTPSKTYGEVITALFIKAINSFRSIMLLCKEGLGDDAGIILRSLLNLAYLVKWIEQEKEERVQRFFGWLCKEKIDLAENLGETPPEHLQTEWEMVRQLFQFHDKKEKLQLVKNWYGDKSIRDLAASLKEEKPPPNGYQTHAEFHYVDGYKPLSNIEHSNPSASIVFLQRNKGHYLNSYLLQDELIHVCLKGGFQYFYLIFEAWNDHFGIIAPEEIKELFERTKEYFQQFQDKQENMK